MAMARHLIGLLTSALIPSFVLLGTTGPAHAEIGMKILGPFPSVEDPDVFFFMRGFPDLASREPMKAQFYEGDLWKRELETLLMPMIEKYDVVLVDDPERLIQWGRT